MRIVLDILREVDLLWNPEVIHGLTVPVAGPGILDIVEVVQVGGVAPNHPAQSQVGVTVWIKQSVTLDCIVHITYVLDHCC